MMKLAAIVPSIAVLAACTTLTEPAEPAPSPSLHETMIVFDSHLDTPINFSRPDFSLIADNPSVLGRTQVDLPKMQRGGLDGGFWVIYTPQGPLDEESMQSARDAALFRASEIREAAAAYEDFELVYTADAAEAAVRDGKRAMLVSMENAYPLGNDISMLTTFHNFGLRMVGPVHFRSNQFADSATDIETPHDGLSPLGEELVKEANRLGMILDGSHAADSTVRDMMALSTTPIILSHSGPKAIFDHPRNIDDDLMRELAASGGVIQINALGSYLEELEPTPERAAALEALFADFDAPPAELPPEQQAEFRTRFLALNEAFPPPLSSFDKYMEHVLHALEVVGPDHIGIGADWDGGGGVEGLEDVSDLPRITEALMEAGYTADDLEKIWSGNMMRLLRQAEAAKEIAD